LPCQRLRLSCSITPKIWLKGRLIQGQMNTFSRSWQGLPLQETTTGHLQVKMNTVQNGKRGKPRNNWGKNWDARRDAID